VARLSNRWVCWRAASPTTLATYLRRRLSAVFPVAAGLQHRADSRRSLTRASKKEPRRLAYGQKLTTFLTFARAARSKKKPAPDGLVTGISRLCFAGFKVQHQWLPSDGGWKLTGQLSQVVGTDTANSIQAMPDGGRRFRRRKRGPVSATT